MVEMDDIIIQQESSGAQKTDCLDQIDIDFDDFDMAVREPVIEAQPEDDNKLPPIETKKVVGSLMVPDEDSSEGSEEPQSDSDSLGLDDDLGQI